MTEAQKIPEHDAGTNGGIDVADRFPEVPPAQNARQQSNGTAEALMDRIAPYLLCRLAGENAKPFTTRNLAEEVPGLVDEYLSLNVVGTIIGNGVRGHGFGLFHPGGRHAISFQNAVRVWTKSSSEVHQHAADLLGISVKEIEQRISSLPRDVNDVDC